MSRGFFPSAGSTLERRVTPRASMVETFCAERGGLWGGQESWPRGGGGDPSAAADARVRDPRWMNVLSYFPVPVYGGRVE